MFLLKKIYVWILKNLYLIRIRSTIQFQQLWLLFPFWEHRVGQKFLPTFYSFWTKRRNFTNFINFRFNFHKKSKRDFSTMFLNIVSFFWLFFLAGRHFCPTLYIKNCEYKNHTIPISQWNSKRSYLSGGRGRNLYNGWNKRDTEQSEQVHQCFSFYTFRSRERMQPVYQKLLARCTRRTRV